MKADTKFCCREYVRRLQNEVDILTAHKTFMITHRVTFIKHRLKKQVSREKLQIGFCIAAKCINLSFMRLSNMLTKGKRKSVRTFSKIFYIFENKIKSNSLKPSAIHFEHKISSFKTQWDFFEVCHFQKNFYHYKKNNKYIKT